MADVKKALEKLKTIGGGQHQHQNFDSGKVEVHFSKKYYMEKKEHLGKINRGGYTAKDIADANKACTAAGDSTIVIQFKSEYGDLPALQVSDFRPRLPKEQPHTSCAVSYAQLFKRASAEP